MLFLISQKYHAGVSCIVPDLRSRDGPVLYRKTGWMSWICDGMRGSVHNMAFWPKVLVCFIEFSTSDITEVAKLNERCHHRTSGVSFFHVHVLSVVVDVLAYFEALLRRDVEGAR